MTNQKKLSQTYQKYLGSKRKKKSLSAYLKGFLPEMIFRTMKLEDEPVTRKMVSSLLK